MHPINGNDADKNNRFMTSLIIKDLAEMRKNYLIFFRGGIVPNKSFSIFAPSFLRDVV